MDVKLDVCGYSFDWVAFGTQFNTVLYCSTILDALCDIWMYGEVCEMEM